VVVEGEVEHPLELTSWEVEVVELSIQEIQSLINIYIKTQIFIKNIIYTHVHFKIKILALLNILSCAKCKNFNVLLVKILTTQKYKKLYKY
jgi:hypothetical protein